MKGDAKVIDALKALVQSEFTAMASYRAHAQILRNAGYKNLKHRLHGYFYEENTHSKELLNRLLLIGGTPDASNFVADVPRIVTDVVAIFTADLALENKAIEDYNGAVEVAEAASDNVTAKLLRHILKEENDHAEWLGKQLAIISDIGRQNYLANNVVEK
jgi:bacterioferritin